MTLEISCTVLTSIAQWQGQGEGLHMYIEIIWRGGFDTNYNAFSMYNYKSTMLSTNHPAFLLYFH